MVYRSDNGQDAYNVALNGSRFQIVSNPYRTNDPRLGTFVDSKHVHTGDGYPRTIIEINGQFPGPTIEVMEGAQVNEGFNGYYLVQYVIIEVDTLLVDDLQ